MGMVCQAFKPLIRPAPPEPLQRRPGGAARARAARRAPRRLDKRRLHNAVRLLTGSAADFLDDYFESEILKGYLALVASSAPRSARGRRAPGLVLLYHSLGEHDGDFGAWSFHKGGNGGFTQVLARAAQLVRRGDPARVAGRGTSSPRTAAPPASRSRTAPSSTPTTVVSALDPRRTFLELVDPRELPDDLVESIRRFRFQGTSSKVNFALDGLPQYPALAAAATSFRGFTNIGPSMDYLERAFDEAKYGWYSSAARTSTPRSSARSTRTWRLPAST